MTETGIPERLRWAVDALAVAPTDHVLEIGCGGGAAISLICDRLTSGRITAIDRSAKMIERAARRNADHVAVGRASLQVAALADVDFGDELFDKILAVNVNLFWTQPATRELDLIRRLLRPGGSFCLCYAPPNRAKAAELSEKLARVITTNGFAIREMTTRTCRSAVLCLLLQPD
ncbi:MAG TPA: class I SAM-dependent methyltransferase [Micromonosporaceae bacterium]|nr:class I SAM-dependent methyltransferase [Micromonosporaceae bacterium]